MPNGGVVESGKDAVVGVKEGEMDLGMEGGWLDKDEFEREQEVVQGGLGNRENGVDAGEGDGGQVPRVRATKSSKEIEQRRKMKKERRIRDRKEREERRKKEKDAGG